MSNHRLLYHTSVRHSWAEKTRVSSVWWMSQSVSPSSKTKETKQKIPVTYEHDQNYFYRIKRFIWNLKLHKVKRFFKSICKYHKKKAKDHVSVKLSCHWLILLIPSVMWFLLLVQVFHISIYSTLVMIYAMPYVI